MPVEIQELKVLTTVKSEGNRLDDNSSNLISSEMGRVITTKIVAICLEKMKDYLKESKEK